MHFPFFPVTFSELVPFPASNIKFMYVFWKSLQTFLCEKKQAKSLLKSFLNYEISAMWNIKLKQYKTMFLIKEIIKSQFTFMVT